MEKKAAQLFFDRIVTHVGLPKQIISDRDTRWRNIFWKEVCESMGSRRALTTAYHPQADGQTEILNQTIEVTIRTFVNGTVIIGPHFYHTLRSHTTTPLTLLQNLHLHIFSTGSIHEHP
jgi:hypothetical protein